MPYYHNRLLCAFFRFFFLWVTYPYTLSIHCSSVLVLVMLSTLYPSFALLLYVSSPRSSLLPYTLAYLSISSFSACLCCVLLELIFGTDRVRLHASLHSCDYSILVTLILSDLPLCPSAIQAIVSHNHPMCPWAAFMVFCFPSLFLSAFCCLYIKSV